MPKHEWSHWKFCKRDIVSLRENPSRSLILIFESALFICRLFNSVHVHGLEKECHDLLDLTHFVTETKGFLFNFLEILEVLDLTLQNILTIMNEHILVCLKLASNLLMHSNQDMHTCRHVSYARPGCEVNHSQTLENIMKRFISCWQSH